MRKQINRYLLILLGCMAAGICFVGQTWAWPAVSVIGKDYLSVGAVDCSLRIRQDEQEVHDNTPLDPGEYTVELTSSGDVEGWFVLRLTSAEGGSEAKVCRTETLAPGQSICFHLHLAETVVLTMEGRWDSVDEDMAVIVEDDVIFWGQSVIDETEAPETEETEAETEAPETEATEPETEAPETEETEAETEAPETEETEAETEAPETEETEAETEAPETEEIEAETEAPETEETEQETEAPTIRKTEVPETGTSEPESSEAAA